MKFSKYPSLHLTTPNIIIRLLLCIFMHEVFELFQFAFALLLASASLRSGFLSFFLAGVQDLVLERFLLRVV